ncbi:MAG: hypothetical protein O2884_12910 [Chloroflexi bacterium]|nr:hypothetical protein [Chloroflexota bacterium]
MNRSLVVLVIVSVAALALGSCGSSGDSVKRAANSFSEGDASTHLVDELAKRTFTDEFGRAHECSEFVTTLVMSSWEPDTESWMITFTGGYEPGTRIFRFYEADAGFERVAGPPLDAACGVE